MAERDIPLIGPLLQRLIGTKNKRAEARYRAKATAVAQLEEATRRLTDADLRGKLVDFRGRVDKGAKIEDVLIEAFAVAREGMDRAVGLRNMFNPRYNFDPSTLPEAARVMYARVKEQMDATPPAPPTGEWMGWTQPIPGWMQVDIPPELYEAGRALYPESKPPYRARPFEVQLIGAMVLSHGKISEMKTGEGKTIVAPLAAYLAAIERMQVHVVTVNDYLVQRDRDWTAPFFRAVGMTVGAIHPQHMQGEDEKRVMYRCHVVYGTTAEFGFDYLRDNMKRRVDDQVQRKRQFAIVDEVDSILIDEARTPLIISGQAHEDEPRYELADRIARHLVEKQSAWQQAEDKVVQCQLRIKSSEGDIRQLRDRSRLPEIQQRLGEDRAQLAALQASRDKHTQYFETKPERKQALLTHDGVAEAQRVAGVGSFYVDQNIDLPHLVEQSLRAHAVYLKDRDYVVMDVPDPRTGQPTPSIVIVDVNTGRPMIGRQWSDGLHQAIECKERVPIKEENQTVATITIQNYFKMYKRLAGMTGTADTEAQEFHDIYKLDVVAIPTNKPVRRADLDDTIYLSAKDKWGAIADEIKAFHDVGRPILVGTTSVEKSEMLSKMLASRHGVKHEVLNAKPEKIAREAEIVENAGQLGSVMIATNMAGRGTDIKLGAFSRDQLLEHWLRRGIAPRTLTTSATEEELREAVYRKLAPQEGELGLPKREAEIMPFADLELALLRHWAQRTTVLSESKIRSMGAEALRAELDKTGRVLFHRLRWFENVEDLGGLHVIGTERHESRRIDNQLRGRSGRQGDKGSTRFFVSMEDDTTKYFAGEKLQGFLARFGGMKEGVSIEHPMLSKVIANVQRKVEEMHFQQRKNLLEYDEVREHQRQRFYGIRQRGLEGRDVKGLLLDWIEDAVQDNADTFLSPKYAAECAAEHATNVLGLPINADRLKGRELGEMLRTIESDALDDLRGEIDRTLGEYLPDERSEVAVDLDLDGLNTWARSRFNIRIDPKALERGGDQARSRLFDILCEAAERKIETTDLSGIEQYLAPDYGYTQLAAWAKDKFGIDVPVDELKAASRSETKKPADVLVDHARRLYREKEVRFPVEYVMDMTRMYMAQAPQEAFNMLSSWANRKYRMGWTPETLRTKMPQQIVQDILKRNEQFVDSNELEAEIKAALACASDDELDAHLQARFGTPLPEAMRFLDPEDREPAIRARVENILRAEMLMFERSILLETLDTLWKDHLYAMDQLRDAIGFRAYSQNDPRIEFKREGSHMFSAMMQSVRDRVTDYVFKARLTPQQPQSPRPVAPAPAPRPPNPSPGVPPAPRPANAAMASNTRGVMTSQILGPGFAAGGFGGASTPRPTPQPAPPSSPAPKPDQPPAS
ncbi:MAG: preprotein translocase subunit SecA [Phycisphaeraceae bacterium]|nr:MAG: preprotein translocase subunit SecA [Phycisphaeraceae bacterium]